MGECSFDKILFEFPLEYNMTVDLDGRSSRQLWHKGSLYVLSRVNFRQYIYLVFFGYERYFIIIFDYVQVWRFLVLCLVSTVMQDV